MTETPGGKNRAGSDALHCDVAVGSALIYSPHHACVADVLSHAFTSGGCRAAYIVQLSTRRVSGVDLPASQQLSVLRGAPVAGCCGVASEDFPLRVRVVNSDLK